ncbi:LuxR C-terminal-related transcriptional regulator [Myroides guanonis]|uniref:Tetratricopeptide repeat-containing protein n=1 Tax=Myroides guanonis TaxID=1150112 RepID=A0A1I3QJ99_9FLAO|nr:LuxR C-terminal-related transcriptional regulator [Myroides guanonis]SFJ34088.1 Tetratricopeptide repeat-containing protein [Myroides guanonis]
MLRLFSFIYSFFLINICYSQNNSYKLFNEDIATFNESKQYEESIRRIESVILNEKSSQEDLYNAYFQKYYTYKRLFNYTEALTNLDLALKAGLKTNMQEEAKIKVAVERMFIHFDLLEFDKVTELLTTISRENVKLLNPETEAFYLSVLGTMNIRSKDYQLADKYLDEALVLLSNHAPKHLPLVYRKKVGLYKSLKKYKEAIESFEKGLYYAEKYKIDIYIIAMYSDISHFYSDIGDVENALRTQHILNKLATDYDNTNISGKLNQIEKELLRELEEQKAAKNRLYFGSSIAILIAIILIVFFFYRSNRQKRIIAEIENSQIRIELDKVVLAMNELNPQKEETYSFNFTDRQLEIITLVKQGKTNKEIGSDLFISENTVKYHLKIIYETLKISRRSEL